MAVKWTEIWNNLHNKNGHQNYFEMHWNYSFGHNRTICFLLHKKNHLKIFKKICSHPLEYKKYRFMSHLAQLQMVVQTEVIAFLVRLTSATIKNDNQRAVKHTWIVIHSSQMVCYISTELASCVFCWRMCPRGKIPPQTRVLANLKLIYIWSYTIAAIYSNDTKHILTSVMLTHKAKLIPSLNVDFDEWYACFL